MKSFLICTLATIAIMSTAYAADCEFGDVKLNIGQTHQPADACELMTCASINSFSGVTCPEQTGFNCEKVEGDLTKPYPQCCPTLKCADRSRVESTHKRNKN